MNSSIQIKLGLTGLAQVTAGLNQLSAGIRSLLAPLAAGAAAVLSVNKIADGLKDIVDLGDKLNNLSSKTGASIQRLMVQRRAFDDAGAGADSLASAYSRLQSALEDAFQNGGSTAEGFRRIGVSVGDMMKLDPGTQFERVAKAIGSLPTPSERTAAALKIFGKSGTDLLPLFRDGGAFDSAAQTLGEMPELMARNASNLSALSTAFGRIPDKVRGLFLGVVDQLDGPIKELTDKLNKIDLTKLGKNIGAFVQVAIDAWAEGRFDKFLSLVIASGFEQGFALAKLMLSIDSKEFWRVLADGLVQALIYAIKYAATGLTEIVSLVAQNMIVLARDFAEVFVDLVDSVSTKLGRLLGKDNIGLLRVDGDHFDQLQGRALESAEKIKEGFGSIFDKAIERWREFMGSTPGATGTPATDALNGLIQDAQSRRVGRGGVADVGVGTESRTPDINSISDQMSQMLRKMDEAFGTLAQKIARAFGTVINSAVDGVANSIKGLLTWTMSWGDALRNIGTSILTGVINSISQMFAEWIVQMTIVRGLKRIFSAEDKVDAATTAAAWTPAAVVTNAATGGIMASIGVPLTLALIVAAVAALSSIAFEHGGYTPGGPTLAMVGESGPEFVIPADATRRLGPQNLAMIHQGVVPTAVGAGGGSSVQINMGVFDDKQRMEDFMRSSQGRKIFVDLAKQHAREITR